MPPLLETLTSNESLPGSLSASAAAAAAAMPTNNPAMGEPPLTTSGKPHSFDIFDTKHRFLPPASNPVVRTSSAALLPEALLACSAKGFSPTGSLKYPAYRSGYCSPTMEQATRGLGICGLTTLRLNAKYSESGCPLEGSTELPGDGIRKGSQTNGQGRGSIGSGKGDPHKESGDRRWCLFVVTFFIALTACVVLVSFVLELILGEYFIDKSSENFRLKTIRQLLRETPLIGEMKVVEEVRD